MSIVAEGLAKRGHEVTVLTSFPNYPTGKIYDGYRQKFFFREDLNGVKIIRVPVFPDKSKLIVRRSRNYLTFFINCFVTKILTRDKFDIIYANNTPVTVGYLGILLGKIYRRPVVVDLQDIWPESLLATDVVKNPLAVNLIRKMTMLVFRQAKKITVISPGFKRNLVKKGIDGNKIEIFYNSAYEGSYELPKFDPALAKKLKLEGFFNVLYAGNLGPAQGIENIIEAADLLRDNKSIQFILAGAGTETARLKAIVKKKKIKSVRFFGWQKMDFMPTLYSLCQAIMVHLTDDALFKITIPGKTQSCLLSGRPVIASIAGDGRELILKAKAGIAAEPMNPVSLSRAINKIYKLNKKSAERMGKNGRDFYYANLSPEVQIPRYEKMFLRITKA